MYGVSLDALMRANGITEASRVQSGQVLRIPGVAAPQAARVPEHPASPRRSSQARALRAPQKGVLSAVEAGLASRSGPELPGPDQAPMGVSFIILPPSEPFSWPVEGGQTRSGFGMRGSRLHAGLDISAPVGSDVRAARSGTVVYSGHKYAGYGNVVMIDHGDGYMTVYAHNSRNLVSAGDTVAREETIAEVGATGNATGSHCHFEIRKGQAAVDPMRFFNQSRDESHVALGSAPAREPARMDQAATLGTQDPTP